MNASLKKNYVLSIHFNFYSLATDLPMGLQILTNRPTLASMVCRPNIRGISIRREGTPLLLLLLQQLVRR
jgi:hypothetical protein